MPVRYYRDLKVWQRAVELAIASYRITKKLPSAERFGLADQIRRSAVSVVANIAEGHGREQKGEFLRFLSIARGSLAELETHLLVAVRLSYITEADVARVESLASETSRMIAGLIRAVRAGPAVTRNRSATISR